MLAVRFGNGAPLNISVMPRARNSSARAARSSPSTTPIFSAMPSSAATCASASRHASGFTPPALATTRMPRAFSCGSSDFIVMCTKSVA